MGDAMNWKGKMVNLLTSHFDARGNPLNLSLDFTGVFFISFTIPLILYLYSIVSFVKESPSTPLILNRCREDAGHCVTPPQNRVNLKHRIRPLVRHHPSLDF